MRSLTKVTDANNSSWDFQYDDVQNLTQKEDALNRITSYEYDNLDRLKKTTQPLSKISTYTYDNNSNVLTTTDPKNQTMTYAYDDLDRIDTGIYRNALNAEKLFHDYEYDREDNLVRVDETVNATNDRRYTRTFDKRNRVKSSTDAYNKTVAFTYDAANNLKSLTDAGSKVTSYNYDQQNRLDTVSQNSATIADYDWYADGLLQKVTYSANSKRDYVYDNADRVTNIANTYGSNSESFDYGYDANSNRETETRNINGAISKTIAYGYDQLNRLESASYTANSVTNQLSYTYDAVGNRKTESGTDQQGNAVNKSADYDDLDRLTKLTETNLISDFEYDNNSNLTKVQLNGTDNETFEYDIRNQLSKYTSIGNGIAVNFDYDFERKRLSKTVSGDRRDYVYAGNQVINEYLADNLNASYGIGSGEIVKSDFAGEGSRNYFSDALGSITSLADNSSSLISRNDYDSFGEIVSSTGLTQNAVTYTGQRLDVESGLMALGNGERYYNPSYGRFIQQDSYAGMPDMPQSLNRFSYTYNNPNKYTDPSGNVPILIPILIGVLFATRVETGRLNAEARRMERGLTQSEAGNSSAIGLGEAVGLTSVINGLSGQDIYTARDLGKWEARGQLALGVLEVVTNVFGLGQSVGTGTKLLKNGVKAYQASSGGVQGGKELIKKGYGGLKNGAKAEYAKTIDELTTLKPFAETGLGQSFFSAKESVKSGYNRIRSSRNAVKKRSIQDNPIDEFDDSAIYRNADSTLQEQKSFNELWKKTFKDAEEAAEFGTLKKSKVIEGAVDFKNNRMATKISGQPPAQKLNLPSRENYPADALENYPVGVCGMTRACDEVIKNKETIIGVTNGGFRYKNKTWFYVSPCKNCVETMKLNPNLKLSPLPPGIPQGLKPKSEIPFTKPESW